MNFLQATQSNWFLIGPIAKLLGYVMNGIFEAINFIGLPNIGLAIILFTIVIKALMIPLSIRQQKTAKLQAVMQPELQAIQAKYKGKTDQESMMAQQQETKAVYAKYGTSMTGGCLQLILQMPILFALYQVILKLPGYITKIKFLYEKIALTVTDFTAFGNRLGAAGLLTANQAVTNSNEAVDVLYSFSPEKWQKFISIFPNYATTYTEEMARPIEQATVFLGIDLTRTPWELITVSHIWWAAAIPILAGVFQWLSTRLSQNGQTKTSNDSNPMGSSMQMMNILFPIMSVVFCFMFNGGIGIYWVASSLVQLLIQLLVNAHLNKVDLNEMVKKNVEKMNAKRIKRGQKPIKVQNVILSAENLEAERKATEARKKTLAEEQANASDYYASRTTAKPGSLAARAGMVLQYEERQKELKSGKKNAPENESK